MGRSSIATSLATYYSQKKQNVLVVQWGLSDTISPIFSHPPSGHKAESVSFNFIANQEKLSFKTMNFNADEAIKEYFVDHLKMKLIYSLIIQNKHVQKLIHAAPGISELFFLGRLFWLVELSQKETGIFYDRIIIDTPATGHGISLFGIAKAVANLGITGPLAIECERVAKLLADSQKTASIFVTLPEELPVEECIESVPKVIQKLGYSPQCIIVNQSVHSSLYPQLESFQQGSDFAQLVQNFSHDGAKKEFFSLVNSLVKRNQYQKKLEEFAHAKKINVLSVPDFNLIQKQISSLQIIECITQFLNQQKALA